MFSRAPLTKGVQVFISSILYLSAAFSNQGLSSGSTSFRNLLNPLAWIDNLILMASMCCQPITHSSARRSIFDLDFQFSKPPTSPDVSQLGSAARLNLSEMDVRASMDERRCEASGAVGQFLS